MKREIQNKDFFGKVIDLLNSARQQVVRHINLTMVHTYFEIGRMIVEEEQNGENRAEYGKGLLKELSKTLTNEFGKGFSETNIRQMRSFYLIFQKQQTLSAEFSLSWSHYLKLMRIEEENERKFYEIESVKNNWSVRVFLISIFLMFRNMCMDCFSYCLIPIV